MTLKPWMKWWNKNRGQCGMVLMIGTLALTAQIRGDIFSSTMYFCTMFIVVAIYGMEGE